MTKYKKHTPEGSQDFLFQECYIKRKIEQDFKNLFKSYGFNEIETPTLEYYDVFAADKDVIAMESMFKFYDSQGRILVLRPDMTIPIARVAATKLIDEEYPIRISYTGNAFKFIETEFDRQKESTQAGIELLGLSSVEADAEVISVAVKGLLDSGFKNFQIDLGQVEFFKGLMEEGNFTDGEIESIRVFIDKKDMIGVEQILRDHEIDEQLRDLIMNLPTFFGSTDIIEKLKFRNLNKRSMEALCYLKKVIELLEDYGYGEYIAIDLGMVQRLNYYTGVIFRGFTYGVGFPVLSGGRYDGLVSKYGRECPSIGFSVNINMVMTALERQKIEILEPVADVLLGYSESNRTTAIRLAALLRAAGKIVEMELQGREFKVLWEYGKNIGTKKVIYVNSEATAEVFIKDEDRSSMISIKALMEEVNNIGIS